MGTDDTAREPNDQTADLEALELAEHDDGYSDGEPDTLVADLRTEDGFDDTESDCTCPSFPPDFDGDCPLHSKQIVVGIDLAHMEPYDPPLVIAEIEGHTITVKDPAPEQSTREEITQAIDQAIEKACMCECTEVGDNEIHVALNRLCPVHGNRNLPCAVVPIYDGPRIDFDFNAPDGQPQEVDAPPLIRNWLDDIPNEITPLYDALAGTVETEEKRQREELKAEGYTGVRGFNHIAKGDRIRLLSDNTAVAFTDGSGTVLGVFRKDPSDWTSKYNRPDVELLVHADRPLAPNYPVIRTADYAVELHKPAAGTKPFDELQTTASNVERERAIQLAQIEAEADR